MMLKDSGISEESKEVEKEDMNLKSLHGYRNFLNQNDKK